MSYKQKQLFKTKIVRAKAGSGKLFEEEFVVDDGPVECLGMTFENDEKRREYFLEKLREKLKDPEFRKIEGFPIGEDDDILALSDPPYYTACPNPFIEDFIKHYGEPYNPVNDDYKREPFAADSKFGKTSNAITRAHPYHTKVPPEAVQTFTSHYMDGKGGILLDCFCGIGMSGVGLNYYQQSENENAAAILCDLSTIASFVSYNYNSREDSNEMENLLNSITDELQDHIGGSFSTRNLGWISGGKQINVFEQANRDKSDETGTIQYILLSEELTCPNCGEPNLLWRRDCIDIKNGKIKDLFPCCNCGSEITKKDCAKIWETRPDPCVKGGVWRIFRQKPVLIYYEYKGKNYCKFPDKDDIANIEKHWENS